AVAVTAWVVSLYRQRQLLKEAEQWLPVEARIESGPLEGTHESGKILLPTFAFSYQVSGEYYSGRFSLMPKAFPTTEILESIIDRMSGRKLLVRYQPAHPEVWFIPDEFIDGLKVEQKIGSHVIHDYYPNA
ncbi:MAG TPA: hypothetical protein VHU83_00065, partial [Bryobacteraceae bacterium]|nr:hypothetical protein [Bryobacteraceae bacterium]